MDQRQWQLSRGTADDARYVDAIGEIKNLVHNDNNLMINETENQYFEGYDLDSDRHISRYAKRLFKSKFFNKLPERLKAESVNGFSAGGSWKYGLQDDESGLIDGQVAHRRLPMQPSDGLVLSGLAGSELIKKSRKLDRAAEALEANPLNRAVLLGGIGLVAAQLVWDRTSSQSGVHYERAIDNQFIETTVVGASMHGDFQMNRSTVFTGPVIDPLMRPQEFGPGLPEAGAYAYHGTETEILADVLKHVSLQGSDICALRSKIVGQWNALGDRPSYAGPYGDFGYDDGRSSASGLRYWLEQPHDARGGETVLTRLLVMPGDDRRLTITSQSDGLRFYHDDRDDGGILIANDEIETFVLALFEQTRRGLGRTSTNALVSVMNVIE